MSIVNDRAKVYKALVCLTVTILFFCTSSWAQKKQLQPSLKVVKIGYIDNIRLRKEYKAYALDKEKLAKENQTSVNSFEASVQAMDRSMKEQLRTDSLAGGLKRKKILEETASKKAGIVKEHQSAQKKRNDKRLEIAAKHEKKIRQAIDGVVSAGGYTDIRPLEKGVSRQNGEDITGIVLQKLN